MKGTIIGRKPQLARGYRSCYILRMTLNDRILQIQKQFTSGGGSAVPSILSGVKKDKVRRVLALIDRCTPDMVDAVFALLDDHNSSFFPKASKTHKFKDGATVAHIGAHVGMLQRNSSRLDREGRDYWLKPLWEIGAIEKVQYDSNTNQFIHGHPTPKSPNNAYRLAPSFIQILEMDVWELAIQEWISEDTKRIRLNLQADIAQQTARVTGSKHQELIEQCVSVFSSLFLPGFRVLYVDDSDGDRISEKDKARLAETGICLGLSDAMPDVLLCKDGNKHLWVIEAVTSDGEVDHHKVDQLTNLAKRSGFSAISFTTAYPNWKTAAARQGKHKNIAPGTYMWIAEDPSKHFQVHGS
jgi:hypothetical protein